MSVLKIKCPMCGSVLNVKPQPGVEKMSVLCPVCKQRSKFTDFAPVKPEMPGEHTQIFTGNVAPEAKAMALRVLSTGRVMPLSADVHLLGRKSATSKADIQVECPGNATSREHLKLEKKIDGQGNAHWLVSLAKDKVNPTSVGRMTLEAGDMAELTPGTVIHLPDVDLEFIELAF